MQKYDNTCKIVAHHIKIIKFTVFSTDHDWQSDAMIKGEVSLHLFHQCHLHSFTRSNYNSKGKGKAVPLQAWSGPEGSRKLRFPDFMTAQGGDKVVSLTHWRPLPPGNTPGTHFC